MMHLSFILLQITDVQDSVERYQGVRIQYQDANKRLKDSNTVGKYLATTKYTLH